MAKRMLVDATHPEETRVVVVNGNRLEDLDFEIASRKQLKGNIYLAKVTRVEPSLQAAFVEYGGNRHGFLAFSEIHPDYYRIPVADREALLAEEERLQAAEERRLDEQAEAAERRSRHRRSAPETYDAPETGIAEAPEPDFGGAEPDLLSEGEDASVADESVAESPLADEPIPEVADTVAAVDDGETDGSAPDLDDLAAPDASDDEDKGGNGGPVVMPAVIEGEEVSEPAPDEPSATDEPSSEDPASDEPEVAAEPVVESAPVEAPVTAYVAGLDLAPEEGEAAHDGARQAEPAADYAHEPAENLDVIGGDEVEEERGRRPRPLRSYKIQEVIKRRQIMLVQVTKEERGNKGAALTTYLSLPGRYCVLMPNTGRGGGISRKITNPADRKRLKEILSDLDVPRGMAVILRTAGLERSKQEIRRDLEYLMRLWDDIREQTMQSTAPALIYEEANLIKRAIRDGFTDDIDEIWVEGETGFKTAREFMRMLMPSHIKRVQHYSDKEIPLFHRYQIETQIDAIHSPVVQLRSGGYIVINPTEALVAIDVNSGKSTRERNIEETALKTNLEAAEEVARQLRLRDLAGLVVIDYIDMEEPRNNAAVERRLKEAMKSDRARIQLGRISAFGLMELSRQRLRPSLLETNFERCPHCAGTGVIRSVESAALHALRAIEEEGIRKRSAEVTVWVPTRIALYILNNKRADLVRIEDRYHFRVNLLADDELIVPDLRIERIKAKTAEDEGPLPITADRVLAETEAAFEAAVEEVEDVETAEAPETEEPAAERAAEGGSEYDRRRRRRRRRGRGERDGFDAASAPQPTPGVDAAAPVEGEDTAEGEEDGEADPTAGEVGENGESGDALARRRRRRGKRGGRRRGRPGEENANGEENLAEGGEDAPAEAEAEAPAVAPVPAPAPVVRAVLPPPGSLSPMDPMDFDWILVGDEPPAPAAEPVIEAEPVAAAPAPVAEVPAEPVAEEKPKRKRATRKKKTAEPVDAPAEAAADAVPVVAEAPAAEPVAEEKPKRKRATRKKKAAEPVDAPAEGTEPVVVEPAAEAPVEAVAVVETAPAVEPAPDDAAARASETVNPAPEKPRRGWWNRG